MWLNNNLKAVDGGVTSCDPLLYNLSALAFGLISLWCLFPSCSSFQLDLLLLTKMAVPYSGCSSQETGPENCSPPSSGLSSAMGSLCISPSQSLLQMEGYPPDLFVEKTDDQFYCGICNLVLRFPMQTTCGCRFCHGCIYNYIRWVEEHTWINCFSLNFKLVHLTEEFSSTRIFFGGRHFGGRNGWKWLILPFVWGGGWRGMVGDGGDGAEPLNEGNVPFPHLVPYCHC